MAKEYTAKQRQEAAKIMASFGGKQARGDKKRRSPEHYQRLALARQEARYKRLDAADREKPTIKLPYIICAECGKRAFSHLRKGLRKGERIVNAHNRPDTGLYCQGSGLKIA